MDTQAPPPQPPTQAAGQFAALQLFGAPTLHLAGRPVGTGARKSVALLAWLALEGRVTRARLAALFWPEHDAASARRNLRRELHRLRSVGADAVLHSTGDTMALAPEVVVDVHHFERALNAGQVAAALGAYRGPLLDGFDLPDGGEFDTWAAGQRERLALRHREATQALSGVHEAAGRWREALDLTLRLIDIDNLHEQHFRRAMQLHAMLGDRESALKLYERCRQRLGRELGLRPMPETQALAEAVRRGEVALAPVPPVSPPPAVPAPAQGQTTAPFVGRTRLLAAVTAPPAGGASSRTVWLAGEPGVGKTRLAQEAANRLGPHLWVQALAGDAAQPYATLARALGSRPADDAVLPTWARQEVARLLPGWADPQGLETGVPTGAADPRRLQAAVALAWQARQASGLQTVVLDDWHLADAATQALWPPGAALGVGHVIVTLRPAEMPPPLREAVQRARHGGACQWLELPPLDTEELPALLLALSPRPVPPALALRLHTATGGNPFFLQECRLARCRHRAAPAAHGARRCAGPAGPAGRRDAPAAGSGQPGGRQL